MDTLEKIYEKMPIFIQNLMTSVKGMANNKTRYGKEYYDYMKFLDEYDTWSYEKKMQHQNEELIKFVKHANDFSPFYKQIYMGIDIDSIKTAADLKKLPVVDKEMLRKNIEEVFCTDTKNYIEGHTGGTTGKSLIVRFTANDMMRRMAMLDHFKKRLGFVSLKMKRATFNGKHIIPINQKAKVFWRYNSACKQMIFSSFNLSEENMKYYVNELNRFKPKSMDGFFSSMCDIAQYIERNNIKLEFKPVAIFPTSETLTESGKELLERVFGCKVYNQYASSEGAPFIVDCKNQVLHMEPASGVFEHFEEGNNEVLVTSFTTNGTPLIRYRIGDTMVFADKGEKCSCGNTSPIVKEIQGRRLDFIYNAQGAKLALANVCNVFKNVPNAIIRSQVIQNKIGEIHVKIEVDKALYKPEYDDVLIAEFAHKIGSDTKVTVERVNEIPREASGKYRMIHNNVTM